MMEQKNETTKQGRAGKNNNSKRHTDEALIQKRKDGIESFGGLYAMA
jgi:hypothetical protein